MVCFFFFSSRRRHTRCSRDWSSDVCSSDLASHLVRQMAGFFVRCQLVVIFSALLPMSAPHLFAISERGPEHEYNLAEPHAHLSRTLQKICDAPIGRAFFCSLPLEEVAP